MFEFRIPESKANTYFAPDVGTRDGLVRVVSVSREGPLFMQVGEVDRRLRQEGRALFTSWDVRRTYQGAELRQAAQLRVRLNTVIEPAGEECGTDYDYSESCPHCGAGRRRRGPLRLPSARLPKRHHIARTIADDEVIVSKALTDALSLAGMTGFAFDQIEDSRSREPNPNWQVLQVRSKPVIVRPETVFGDDPFVLDGESRCPLGHVAGLALVSELFVAGDSWDRSDLAVTNVSVGVRRGLLVPAPILLVSGRVFELKEKAALLGGTTLEVVHLVP
jgi:hypothetical protein